MKVMTQLEAIRSVRKPLPPPGRVERPVKGGNYRRRSKHRKEYEAE
jgi:hypothetical protein